MGFILQRQVGPNFNFTLCTDLEAWANRENCIHLSSSYIPINACVHVEELTPSCHIKCTVGRFAHIIEKFCHRTDETIRNNILALFSHLRRMVHMLLVETSPSQWWSSFTRFYFVLLLVYFFLAIHNCHES